MSVTWAVMPPGYRLPSQKGPSLKAIRRRPSPLFGAAVVEGGEVGADLVGFGQAEVGVEGQGVLVVLAGEGGVAEGAVGVAEAGVGAGLLVAVADVGGDGVGGGVVGEGVGGAAGGVGGFAEAVERPGFAVPVAGLAEDGQGLLVVLGGLGGLAEAGVQGAEAVQRPGFAGRGRRVCRYRVRACRRWSAAGPYRPSRTSTSPRPFSVPASPARSPACRYRVRACS